MVKIKNAMTSSSGTFDKISKILSQHGANKVMYDYKGDGTLEAITFGMQIEGQQIGFRLPALVENVVEIMYGGQDRYGRPKKVTPAQREQAYKTAWANIRDWIDAQMALIDTKQVKLEQVFLPYMLNNEGKTLYESVSESKFKLLG